MHKTSLAARLAASLAGLLLAVCCGAASAGERATSREARAMFDQAVKYLQANGPEKSWAAFSDRKGPFVKKDLYVYVIDRRGTYVANGAAPDTLVGLNVLDSVDAAGTPLFRHMIAVTDKQTEARIRYVWLNRKTNHVEPKNAWLHRSGDYILGVGYYSPHATAIDAQKLLGEAVAFAIQNGMGNATKAFNDGRGAFVHDDLYVFAVNLDSGKFEAHGMNPAWTGTDARDLHDVEGHALIQEMIDQAKTKGTGVVDYVWRNPVTNAVERKRSFIQRVDNSLLGVGYYLD
ncbi:MAG: cache domain-containing protein [Gammaproteobacteria bacterium]|nr:cache domain-containing protein [Gammaproteobacteria bacterium]MBU1603325.1 cache domain-containing protein [Gammaproteobacteria bacterium]MBU2432845.1 cache domain-containing protein [Gammaproteobacteria bacterium]MBU2450088.1 cache domain-containing protein [Gammaproteobacteria bacterium]